ncbi:phage virion morphogenesis protein [Yersinia ruckeri]|uniref:phage virion morphogenesis protein n=1 Tax=Yersinia TaxID=629 RepID=UPI0022646872|nr:phage virion morphogenesis protein [Yersinia ruckeri]UZX55226.1 phage virion morphogenesis protein [Yersinia ruckeri]
MSELKLCEDRLAGLIANLTPPQRRKIAFEVAKRLRTSQQQRIKRQQTPDGMPYSARKRQTARSKNGRVRRAMFIKLSTNKFMDAAGTPNAALIAFTTGVRRMVRVHQYGLMDRPHPKGKLVKYDERPLLGLSPADKHIVEEVMTAFLTI